MKHLRRAGHPGQGDFGLGYPLLHGEPSPVGIGPRLEYQLYRGKARRRVRANVLEPGDTVQKVLLHRHGNQLFDFVGRQPQGFCLDLDRRRPEFRERVYGHIADVLVADEKKGGSDDDNRDAGLEEAVNEPAH